MRAEVIGTCGQGQIVRAIINVRPLSKWKPKSAVQVHRRQGRSRRDFAHTWETGVHETATRSLKSLPRGEWMKISFESVYDFRGWGKGPRFLADLVEKYRCQRILEVGSGANPTLDPDYVRRTGLQYVTSDLDEGELAKADPAFERLVIDLSSEVPAEMVGSFDCVFSRMTGEHIRDGGKYHKNIYSVLRPGGISVHCFSTLWTLPFAVNYLLPDGLTQVILNLFNPREDAHQHGKFKAYYSWSRGPTKTMIKRFQSLGFEIVEYIGCFGHPYYSKRLPWLDSLERKKSAYLLKHPIPQLCSYSTIILRKPE